MDTAINEAIEQEDIERVRAILESDDEDQVKFIDADEHSSLEQDTFLVACRVGNVQIYELLASHFQSKGLGNAHRREYEQDDGTVVIQTTHFCEALRHGNIELVNHLLKMGVDVNARWRTDDDSYDGDEDRFHGIVTSRSGIAWWLANNSMWPELLKYGLAVDAYVDALDGTAICKAIVQGKDDLVELLLKLGADPSQEFLADMVRSFPYEIGKVNLLVLAMHAYYNQPDPKRMRIVSLIFDRAPLATLSQPIWVEPFGDDPAFSPAQNLTEYVLANEESPVDVLFGLVNVRKLSKGLIA